MVEIFNSIEALYWELSAEGITHCGEIAMDSFIKEEKSSGEGGGESKVALWYYNVHTGSKEKMGGEAPPPHMSGCSVENVYAVPFNYVVV